MLRLSPCRCSFTPRFDHGSAGASPYRRFRWSQRDKFHLPSAGLPATSNRTGAEDAACPRSRPVLRIGHLHQEMHATNPSLDKHMKNILSIITLLLLAAASSVVGQGAVNFNNRVTGAGGIVAPIYGVNPNCVDRRLSGNAITNGGSVDYTGFPLLFGTSYTAALWANQPGVGWVQLAQTPFRTAATLPGFFTPVLPSPQVPWVTMDGTPVEFQVRAWHNLGGIVNTWAEALSRNFTDVALGSSDVFTAPVAVLPPATLPSPLIGLTSFNLAYGDGFCVPEPSMVLLSTLAGIALLWRRKKVSR